jgi:hypothetical protein
LSDPTWQRLFDRDPSAIGRTILVNATPRLVAGVVDVPASIPGAADVWLPYPDDAALLRNRRARLFTVVGRLMPGVSAAGASSELNGIARQVRREAPCRPTSTSRSAQPCFRRGSCNQSDRRCWSCGARWGCCC